MPEVLVNTSDHNREGFSMNKMIHFLRVLFVNKATEVLEFVDDFSQIDFEKLQKNGKTSIILDIDECVAPHHGNIFPENIEIISELVATGWKIVVFSNMKKSDRYIDLEDMGIEVITSRFAKPNKKGFLECLEKLNSSPIETIMIGDNFLTDGGCKQVGIDFVKVKPLFTEKNGKYSLNREVQKFTRNIIDILALTRHKY